MTRLVRSLFIALVAVLLPASLPAHAQPLEDAVQERLRTRIEADRRGLDGLNADGEVVHTSAAVTEFYENRDFAPAWIDPDGASPAVDRLMRALRRADREGLNGSHYHADSIAALQRATEARRNPDIGHLSDLELLCTDAFLLYASDLLSGRVSPTTVTPTWNIPARETDLRETLREATNSGFVGKALSSLRPSQSEYTSLVKALGQYRSIVEKGGWPTVPDGPKLELGSTGPRVEQLRKRLAITQDLPPSTSTSREASGQFDEQLKTAVSTFQERHGLTADGVVGPSTLEALNVPAEQRVRQLIVNLERWRWMPESLGERYVLVNIAAARLRVIEGDSEAFSMRVVTGLPFRQTPVFSDEISYLVFNPYWHVPHSIATEDKLPVIKKDPSYLQRQNMSVLRGWGANEQAVAPSTIDWSSLSEKNFPYRLRQDPGPYNALGRIKFMFPNPHNVYLHDTPTRGLFAQSERNFSSGCIRVEHPTQLAEYLLSDHPQWTPQRIQSVLKTPSGEQSVPLRTRIPVHLQYWTAWADSDGTVHFRKDSYARDDDVYRALTAPAPSE